MYNHTGLQGRLTADPELRYTQQGTAITSFTLASDTGRKTKDGKKITNFIECVAWRAQAEFVCKYLSKGRLVLVEGELTSRSYTKQAQPDYGGTLKGGRSIYFEAKHTDDERIEQRRLTQEQQDDLEAHHKLGAIAFVLVSVSLTDFYRVPWPVWRDMAEIYGRKYMTHAELSRYEVPATAGFIKFLHDIESETLGKEDAHDPTP